MCKHGCGISDGERNNQSLFGNLQISINSLEEVMNRPSHKLRTNVVGGEQIFDQVSERTRVSLFEFSQKAFLSSYEKLSPNYSKSHSNDALKINSRGGLRLEREPNFRSAFFCKVFNDSNINIRENPTRKAAYPLELIN